MTAHRATGRATRPSHRGDPTPPTTWSRDDVLLYATVIAITVPLYTVGAVGVVVMFAVKGVKAVIGRG